MYRLIIQPFDSSYDFLEDIIANAKSIYKIRVAEIAEERRLPEKILLKPKSMLAKFFMKDRRMVHLNDLMGELKRLFWHKSKNDFTCNSATLHSWSRRRLCRVNSRTEHFHSFNVQH
jgi:hypothetical protein